MNMPSRRIVGSCGHGQFRALTVTIVICGLMQACGTNTETPKESQAKEQKAACVKPVTANISSRIELNGEVFETIKAGGLRELAITHIPQDQWERTLEYLNYDVCEAYKEGKLSQPEFNRFNEDYRAMMKERVGIKTDQACLENDINGRCTVCVFLNLDLAGQTHSGSQAFTCRRMPVGQRAKASLAGLVLPGSGVSKNTFVYSVAMGYPTFDCSGDNECATARGTGATPGFSVSITRNYENADFSVQFGFAYCVEGSAVNTKCELSGGQLKIELVDKKTSGN